MHGKFCKSSQWAKWQSQASIELSPYPAFFSGYEVNYNHVAGIILHLLPQKSDFVISIDRTNWQFGKTNINILVAGIVYKGIAIPIVWMLLDKQGNSNTKERKILLKKLFKFIGKDRVKAITADREFIGKVWFKWLIDKNIAFYIRVKDNASVTIKNRFRPIKCIFAALKVGNSKLLRKPRIIYGNKLYVAGAKLAKEYLIVVTNQKPAKALEVYRLRWEIETLFAALKKRGFNFEDTHMTELERIKKLVALLAIAFSWAHLVGEWLCTQKPLKIKKHGAKEKSIFRYGLDHLQHILLNIQDLWEAFILCLKLFQKGLIQPPVLHH